MAPLSRPGERGRGLTAHQFPRFKQTSRPLDDEVPLSSLLRKESASWQPELNRPGKWGYLVEQFRNLLGGLLDEDRKLLLHVAARAARKRKT
jgi:hypothetical protein